MSRVNSEEDKPWETQLFFSIASSRFLTFMTYLLGAPADMPIKRNRLNKGEQNSGQQSRRAKQRTLPIGTGARPLRVHERVSDVRINTYMMGTKSSSWTLGALWSISMIVG